MGENKIYWIDSLKLLAALLVFSTHFLAEYAPEFLGYWEQGHILYGITGKLAVSFFFLMSGYFAMKVRRENAWNYIVKRYLRMMVPVLLIETAVLFIMFGLKTANVDAWLSPEMTGRYLRLEHTNYQMFLSDIFLLDGKVVATYWGNFMLFSGPVIVMLLHGICIEKEAQTRKYRKVKNYMLFVVSGFIFFLLGYVWYSICMLGAILYMIVNQEKFKIWEKWSIKILLLIIIFICIRTPESNIAYMLKGFASFCLVCLVFYTKKIQYLLENRIFQSLSKYSFEIYLVHIPVNLMLISFIFGFLSEKGLPHKMLLACLYLLSLFLTFLCSKALQTAAGKILHAIGKK